MLVAHFDVAPCQEVEQLAVLPELAGVEGPPRGVPERECEVDAGEQAAVESIRMSAMNDEIVEVGLQPDRGPTFLRTPSIRAMRDGDLSGHTPGTGMGLAIAKGIVEAHSGRIWIENVKNDSTGTRVVVLLPTGDVERNGDQS